MAYLLDTNVLVRLANKADPQHQLADRAIEELLIQGETLHVTAQNLVEFRSAATRPQSANGLGLDFVAAEVQAAAFETSFPLLDETPAIYPAWKALVRAAQVTGKQVHDARLVAVCQVHGISHLLTFNGKHFLRFASALPQLAIVDPAAI